MMNLAVIHMEAKTTEMHLLWWIIRAIYSQLIECCHQELESFCQKENNRDSWRKLNCYQNDLSQGLNNTRKLGLLCAHSRKPQAKQLCFQLSSFVLKTFKLESDTAFSGSLFQLSTILWLKKNFLTPSRSGLWYNFRLCPLRFPVVFLKKVGSSTFSRPCRIL